MREMAVLLHNVRSAHNVGSIFRTADAAGISRIVLTGYTPAPVDRFGRVQKEVAKTALGAELVIPWTTERGATEAISGLKKRGWAVVGIEQDERALDYREFRLRRKTVFVLGNEVRGLSSAVRRACDSLIQIPMHGAKESLNVGVAAGIVLFSVR